MRQVRLGISWAVILGLTAAIPPMASAQSTLTLGPGILRSLSVASSRETVPSDPPQISTFDIRRGGYTVRIRIPSRAPEGALNRTTPGTGTIHLRTPLQAEVGVFGTSTAQVRVDVTHRVNGEAVCTETRTFTPGAIGFTPNCALDRIQGFNSGAVSNGIVQGTWFIEVRTTPAPLNSDDLINVTASPNYDFSAAGDDIEIDRLMPVQVVQDADGSIPLIPEKSTLLRAFLRNRGSGEVTGVRGKLVLPDLALEIEAANSGEAIAPPGPPDVSNLKHSLNFIIDAPTLRSYIQSASNPDRVRVRVEAMHPQDVDPRNNFRTADFDFLYWPGQQRRNIVLAYWAVCVNQVCPNLGQIDAHTTAMAMMPIPELMLYPLPLHHFLPPIHLSKAPETAEELLQVLRGTYRTVDLMKPALLRALGISDAYVMFFPLLPASAGSLPAFQEFKFKTNYILDTCTANQTDLTICGQETKTSFWRTVFGRLVNDDDLTTAGRPGVAGFDGFNRSILDRRRLEGDLLGLLGLSENGGPWITPSIYARAIPPVRLRATAPSPLPISPTTEKNAAEEEGVSLILSGSIVRDGSSGSLDPAFQIKDARPSPADPSGQWCIRSRRPAMPDSLFCFNPEPDEGSTGRSAFSLAIPWSADTTSVALVRRESPEAELAILNAGDPIQLAINGPTVGQVLDGIHTISWSGFENTGRSLAYALLYSSDDGASWFPLAVDLTSSTFDLDTARMPGTTSARLRVIASSGLTNATAEVGPLEIRRRGQLEVVSRVVDFGSRTVGETVQETVWVRNTGTGSVRLELSLAAASPFSLVAPSRLLYVPPGVLFPIAVRYFPLSAGTHEAELRIAGAESVLLRGRAFADLIPSIALAASVDFGDVETGTPVERPITIRNVGRTALTVQPFTGSSQSFQPVAGAAAVSVAPGGEANLRVRILLSTVGPAAGRLTIRSNDPSRGTVEVAVTANGVAPRRPSIDASPLTLDFGDVQANSSRSNDLTIANRGAGALTVTAMTSSNARFALVSPTLPVTIAPGAERIFVVRFTSGAIVTAETGVLTITSNDPGSPTRINLRASTAGGGPSPTAANFAGEWNVVSTANTGGSGSTRLSVTQTGSQVTATYASGAGTLSGTVNGNVLTANWQDSNGRGTMTFTMAANGNSFSGPWACTAVCTVTGTWNATRATGTGTSPTAANFAGEWNVVSTANTGGSGSTRLSVTQTGSQVTATYASGAGTLSGTVNGNVLTANWQDSNGRGTMTFTMAANGNSFSGPWACTAVCTVNGTWNATRATTAPASPAITVSPVPMDFATVAVGSTATRTLTIRNTGTAALHVSSISIGSTPFNTPPFTVTPASIPNIAPGASADATVAFRPTSTGAATASLTVLSNDPGRSTVTVALSGTGGSAGGPSQTGVTLSVDDGSFESSIGFPDGGVTAFFVNRLTPPRYPATVRAVQIYFPANQLPVGTNITILATTLAPGQSGSALPEIANFQPAAARITALGQFVEYAIPPITISSGDFLVGFSVQNPADVFPAAKDNSPPFRERSYVGTSAARLVFPTNPGNLAIRARVDDTAGVTTPGCLDMSGVWRHTTASVGTSNWALTPNADGTYRAIESGLGGATGTAVLHSPPRLRIDFVAGTTRGFYDWTLDPTCSQGSGNLVFTAGGSGTHSSTVTRVR